MYAVGVKRRYTGEYIPRPIGPKPYRRRFDKSWTRIGVTTTKEASTLLNATEACTFSLKNIHISIRCKEDTVTVAGINSSKWLFLITMEKAGIATGVVSIAGSDAITDAYDHPNNVLYCKGGVHQMITSSVGPVVVVQSEPLQFDITFKKLKRRVLPGDSIYFQMVTNADGGANPALNFIGSATYFCKQY